MHKTQLAAKIAAHNANMKNIHASAPAIWDVVARFVGEKIVKADGQFTRKFVDALPNIGARNYWRTPNYNVALTFIADENGPRSSERNERTVYFGDLENGVLTRVLKFDHSNFTYAPEAEAIIAAREEVKRARAALSEAENKLQGFGEWD